jgi:hypothetical protein
MMKENGIKVKLKIWHKSTGKLAMYNVHPATLQINYFLQDDDTARALGKLYKKIK